VRARRARERCHSTFSVAVAPRACTRPSPTATRKADERQRGDGECSARPAASDDGDGFEAVEAASAIG